MGVFFKNALQIGYHVEILASSQPVWVRLSPTHMACGSHASQHCWSATGLCWCSWMDMRHFLCWTILCLWGGQGEPSLELGWTPAVVQFLCQWPPPSRDSGWGQEPERGCMRWGEWHPLAPLSGGFPWFSVSVLPHSLEFSTSSSSYEDECLVLPVRSSWWWQEMPGLGPLLLSRLLCCPPILGSLPQLTFLFLS